METQLEYGLAGVIHDNLTLPIDFLHFSLCGNYSTRYKDGTTNWPEGLRLIAQMCESGEQYHGNLRAPPQCHPATPENKALLGDSSGTMMVNNPLVRPYFLVGLALGGYP